MCELFGISSGKSIEISEYLREFYSHSSEHRDGWGFARLDNDHVQIKKEPCQASRSEYLLTRLTKPVVVENAFAHIRYATIGNVEEYNCHPFTCKDRHGRQWTLIHNGTIFEYDPLNRFFNLQEGDSDSERILLYVVDQINRKEYQFARALDAKERFCLLDRIVSDMAAGNKLNLMLYDGETMYVHTNYRDSLHYLEKQGGVLFSTQPLSEETWRKLPMTTLLGYQQGVPVFTGTNHGQEFFDDPGALKPIYQIFANL